MWRIENRSALLVGMLACVATMESSMEIPQKIKNASAFLPSDPTFENLSEKKPQNTNSKEHKHPMFFAVSFTITKIWKQPKCLSVDEWIK